MREHLLILELFTTAASAAEPQVYACPPTWPQDRECFRQQTIYFNTGSFLLRKEAKQHITEVADFLKARPSAALAIEGHCDDRGSEEHNRWLGDRRARAIAKELVRVGVAADRVDTISFGKDRPVDSEHDAKARQKNRRAEFVLLTRPRP
jgi:peptidoglycan-associated lipoprotein